MGRAISLRFAALVAAGLATGAAAGSQPPPAEAQTELALAADDVIPTGNDWYRARRRFRAGDAASSWTSTSSSMRYRGLIEPRRGLSCRAAADEAVAHRRRREEAARRAALEPARFLSAARPARWRRTALRTRISYVAPTRIAGRRSSALRSHEPWLGAGQGRAWGMEVNWARTNRVTYSPEPLTGARTMSPTPIDSDMEVFNYKTERIASSAWGFAYVGCARRPARCEWGSWLDGSARRPALAPGQRLWTSII